MEDQLDYRAYWRQSSFDDKPLTSAYWDDPWPDVQGMLTSELIASYDDAVGGMIYPFNPELLKAASYELTLGWRCMVEGKDVRRSEKHPWLVIPPNAIAFVSAQQVLRLPHYVVGRFDLVIDFIYQGLLLGTGPQVDPGFQGALGCPLHNISNSPIYLRLGRPFAKIDFVKTAAPVRASRRVAYRQCVEDESDLKRLVDHEPPLPGFTNVKLFKGGRVDWREPVYGYLSGKRPRSSVAPIREQLDRVRRFGVIGLITLLLTAGTFVVLYVQAKTDGQPQFQDLEEQRRELDGELRELRQRIDALKEPR